MTQPDDTLDAAAFLVETRVRHEANRRVLHLTEAEEPDVDAHVRAAASLLATRQQHEATERALRAASTARTEQG